MSAEEHVQDILPDGAIPMGSISITSFMDLDGDEAWAFSISGMNSTSAIALLEKLKFRVLCGDLDDAEDDEDDEDEA